MSNDNLDFERVAVNTRKTVKIRLENLREVNCEWWYYNPAPVAQPTDGKNKIVENFSVFPLSGSLMPGQRTSIDVMFIPNSDKPFT